MQVTPARVESQAEPGLTVLICNQFDTPPTLRPDWYPIELFTIEDQRLPDHWEFTTVFRFGQPPNPEATVLARWGYPLLVTSDEHFDGLAERDPRALKDFLTEYERNGHS